MSKRKVDLWAPTTIILAVGQMLTTKPWRYAVAYPTDASLVLRTGANPPSVQINITVTTGP